VKYSDPQLVDRLASSYVLGTLAGRARQRFERLMRDRTDLRLAVARWEASLGRLASSVAPVEPSARVWRAIEARTRGAAGRGQPRSSWPWWTAAGWGFGGVAAGLAVAFALLASAPALFLTADQVAMRTGGKLPQSYVGLLTDAEGNGKLLVSSLRHGKVMTIKAIGPIDAPPAGQKLVLWALPPGAPPFVLGQVPTRGSAVSELPDTSERLLSKVTRLAVTLEASEAPAAPGPVVYSGNCAKLW